MSDNIKIGILGGDSRMLMTIKCLSVKYECAVWGYSSVYTKNNLKNELAEEYLKNAVRCMDFDSAVRGSDAVVLPLPAASDGVRLSCPLAKEGSEEVRLTEICAKMKPGALLLGGMMPPLFKRFAEEQGIRVCDYYDDEEMQILNSVPTAEGAIMACMEQLPITVSGMRAAVVGYGRVGRTLSGRLKALGADVFAVARSKRDLSWAKCDGCIPVPLDEYRSVPVKCDAVFNTVPSMIFDKNLLSLLDKNTVLFELAAKPGGIDTEEANNFGIKTLSLPALPGKTSPDTAGEIICGVVSGIIGEYLQQTDEKLT